MSINNKLPVSTWAKLFRQCRTRRNPGTSVRGSMPEESPSPPAVSCNHLQHAKARDEALGKSTADVLLTKPPMFMSGAFRFPGICR
jgi:hypothetical protein